MQMMNQDILISSSDMKCWRRVSFSPAPQVIRKIRSETFSDASGHLKLWCQFFNVLADSTVRWFRNEEEIAQLGQRYAPSGFILWNTDWCMNIISLIWWVFFLSLKPSNFIFSAGDEAQVNLAVVQASYKDSGVYKCTITNDYGTDSTDCLLSGESTYFFTLNFQSKTD